MVIEWTVRPGRGLAGCPLGASSEQVNAILGNPTSSFRRAEDGPIVHDHEVHGVQVTYNDADEAVFMEVAAPADPTLLDVYLVGRLAVDAFADLRSVGVALVEDDVGAAAPVWCVGLYVPDDRIEAVSFERGAESAS